MLWYLVWIQNQVGDAQLLNTNTIAKSFLAALAIVVLSYLLTPNKKSNNVGTIKR